MRDAYTRTIILQHLTQRAKTESELHFHVFHPENAQALRHSFDRLSEKYQFKTQQTAPAGFCFSKWQKLWEHIHKNGARFCEDFLEDLNEMLCAVASIAKHLTTEELEALLFSNDTFPKHSQANSERYSLLSFLETQRVLFFMLPKNCFEKQEFLRATRGIITKLYLAEYKWQQFKMLCISSMIFIALWALTMPYFWWIQRPSKVQNKSKEATPETPESSFSPLEPQAFSMDQIQKRTKFLREHRDCRKVASTDVTNFPAVNFFKNSQ